MKKIKINKKVLSTLILKNADAEESNSAIISRNGEIEFYSETELGTYPCFPHEVKIVDFTGLTNLTESTLDDVKHIVDQFEDFDNENYQILFI